MTTRSRLSKPTVALYAVWLVLLGVVIDGFITGMFAASFIGLATLFLTVLPLCSGRWLRIELPSGVVREQRLSD